MLTNCILLLKLFPLLIQSLSLPDPNLKVSTLDTFHMTTADAPQVVVTHVNSLIPAMLNLSKATEANTMKVRIAALRCLSQFPSALRYDVLRPFKTQVLAELAQALDDKKRLVRRHAVDCRAKWLVLNSHI
ncbi:hypothetical protein BC937DRAFT_86151 [Endogone sp. FLAS-F59071]|nr:hypothetical protein BC937DRAFT_86151 [Endogone sp. FLAS-F59071]|eukprot:RUS23466.1 hypothetical protein BC937DRAFT_86151 [Endogone sp. FLAS-F59071]